MDINQQIVNAIRENNIRYVKMVIIGLTFLLEWLYTKYLGINASGMTERLLKNWNLTNI